MAESSASNSSCNCTGVCHRCPYNCSWHELAIFTDYIELKVGDTVVNTHPFVAQEELERFKRRIAKLEEMYLGS